MANSNLKRGDVVVVPFPYADQLTEKRRPVLVISNSTLLERHGLVWVTMITSAENDPWADDIVLPRGSTGLNAASVIRISKIATIEASRVVRLAGHCDAETIQRVDAAMAANLR